MVKVYIDGASSGNPGKVGIGYVIYRDDALVKQESIFLGIQSNNFAEYMALIFSLSDIIAMGDMAKEECSFFSDSKLVCEQIAGRFKVKNQNIYSLFVLAKHLISKINSVTIRHIPREENAQADKLAKDATGFLV